MKTAFVLTLILAVSLSIEGYVGNDPLFELIDERSDDGSPIFMIKFPNGHQDMTVLSKFYSNDEDRLADKEHCNYVGHLYKSPESLIAMTGCTGQEIVSITLLSKHIEGLSMLDWHLDGAVKRFDMSSQSSYLHSTMDFEEDVDFNEFQTIGSRQDSRGGLFPDHIILKIRVGYDKNFNNHYEIDEGIRIIESTLAHLSILLRQGLGTTITLWRIGSINFYDRYLWSAPAYDVESITEQELQGAHLMVYATSGTYTDSNKVTFPLWSGKSNQNQLCNGDTDRKKYSVSYVHKEFPHKSAWELAHQIGHNLGLYDDFDPKNGGHGLKTDATPCNQEKAIMSYHPQYDSHGLVNWSKCSKYNFMVYLRYLHYKGWYDCIVPPSLDSICYGEDGCCHGQCKEGEGDCNLDNDCANGYFCGFNNCDKTYVGDDADCCLKQGTTCTGADSCCTASAPCGRAEGDCAEDVDCNGELQCGAKNCRGMNPYATHSFEPEDDCCACLGGDSCCTKSTPCGRAEGDCDSDIDCIGSSSCGKDNCLSMNYYTSKHGFQTEDDCCICKGGDDCCSPTTPCGRAEGDCDSDSDCFEGLRCGTENCKELNFYEQQIFDIYDSCCFCSGGDECCTPSTPCGSAEGDCDSNRDCIGSKICGEKNCKDMNPSSKRYFDAEDDCCICNGEDTCCTEAAPCGRAEGDCDTNYDCKGHLKCGKDNCLLMNQYTVHGYEKEDDCCACTGGDFCCTPSTPCGRAEGDCDSDSDCLGSMKCGSNNCWQMNHLNKYDFSSEDDCCTCNGGDDCCTEATPCGKGEGDCDSDHDCVGNLFCGNDNCRKMHPNNPNDYEAWDDCCDQVFWK